MEFLTAKDMHDIHMEETLTETEKVITDNLLNQAFKVASNPLIQTESVGLTLHYTSHSDFNLDKVVNYLTEGLGYAVDCKVEFVSPMVTIVKFYISWDFSHTIQVNETPQMTVNDLKHFFKNFGI